MTTRDEAKKMDPESSIGVAWHTIYVDDDLLSSYLINMILRKIKSRKRVRIIVCEDAVRGCGIWTLEEAGDIADRMIFGKDGEFYDPKNLWQKFMQLFMKKKRNDPA